MREAQVFFSFPSTGRYLTFFLALIISMLFLFSSCEKRKYFWIRFLIPSLTMCILTFFQPMAYLILNRSIGLSWPLGFLLDFLLALGIIFFSFKVPLPSLFFYGTAAWCIQHIFTNIDTFINNIGRQNNVDSVFFREEIHVAREIIIFSLLVIVLATLFLKSFHFQENFIKTGKARIFILSIASVSIVYLLSNYSITHGGLRNNLVIAYDCFCCCFLLILFYFISNVNHLEKQKIVLDEIQKINSKQQVLKKESYESIAIRYHDLSKQIALLELSNNSESKQKLIEEIRGELENFASFADTQNKALDIVLSEKKMVCLKNDIKLFYKVDAHVLDFMDEVDVYTIFSNLFDNAIESVKEEKKENKVIKLNIYQRGNIISIDCQNYTSKDIAFKDGLPLTSKENSQLHGYGSLSIKRVAEKYKGSVLYNLDKSIFNVYILLQRKENKQKMLLVNKL